MLAIVASRTFTRKIQSLLVVIAVAHVSACPGSASIPSALFMCICARVSRQNSRTAAKKRQARLFSLLCAYLKDTLF